MTREKRQPSDLRRRAEERVDQAAARHAEKEADARRLVHELEVHQVELELQNEELRAARVEIEAGLRRYTELFDFAPIGYVVVSGDGTVLEANLAAARLVGFERRRLVGLALSSVLSPGDGVAFSRFLAQVLRSAPDDGSRSCQLRLLQAPDDTRDVQVTAAAWAGPAPSALLALEDVTGRKHAEEALRAEAHRKDEFLAALSHELRNPLAPIRNALTVLSRVSPSGEQAGRALEILDRQVTHLTHIVDDLLDVTRVARGKIRLNLERIELRDLVLRTVEDHRATFEGSGVAVGLDVGEAPCWADADATRVVQVLGNLLGNASKFTARGGRVDVTVRHEGAHVALRVRDDGAGIASEVREHLFEPFSQAPQTLDRTRGGLGLGLAMVKGLVELHGGTATVSSGGLGRGAEFTVRLPAAEEPGDAPPASERQAPARRRVLVIEDNEDAATTLRDVLELSGHDVRVALDGHQGVAVARQFRPEVVLCDIGLPGINGYDVARALRADEATRSTYLVALTGYALPDDQRLAREAGFDRHLAKPPAIESLERLFEERERVRS